MLELNLLGHFEVCVNGQAVEVHARSAELLAYLALSAGTPHRRDKLAGMFWPETTDSQARTNLRKVLWRLRHAVGEQWITTNRDSVALIAGDVRIDTATLERETDALRAVSVYKGELLPGFYEDWVLRERDRLRMVFEQKMERLLAELANEHQWHEVLEWAEYWITLGPECEPAYRALMRAQAARGDRASVVAVYERCLTALDEELGVLPSPETIALYDQLITEDVCPKHNLPASVTSFVGRERELTDVRGLLGETRLLTLTGPGGIGKTRLGLQAAAQLVADFRDGVYFVELASIGDPTLLATAIAGALSVPEMAGEPPAETLKRFLQGKQLLLLLDNFEHLLEGAQLISELLRVAPGLKILTTSRELLQIYGEQVYPLPALPQEQSVELFRRRARAVRPDFAIDDNADTVNEICVRLDGLPLAIELAAARVRLLSPQALLSQLGSRLDVLRGSLHGVPARQQTLRATLDWSYELLDASEQVLFNRLGVFAGGCSLEAAEAVCREDLPLNLANALESLLNKNLLVQRAGFAEEPRFLMLETLRAYALERLAESREEITVGRRHAEYYVTLAEEADPELLLGRRETAGMWAERLEQELDNIRAALQWALAEHEVELGLRMTAALTWFWFARNHDEGRRWAEDLLSRSVGVHVPARAKTLNSAAMMAFLQGEYEQARERLEAALSLSQQLGDRHTLAWTTMHLGAVYNDVELTHEALELFREFGDVKGMSVCLNSLGERSRAEGDYGRARAQYEEAIAMCRRHHLGVVSFQLYNLATALRRLGDYEQARSLYEDGLAASQSRGQSSNIAAGLIGLAGLLTQLNQFEPAARLFGAAEAIYESVGDELETVDQREYDRDVAALHNQLDEKRLQAAWGEGRAMTLEQAVNCALRWSRAQANNTP